MTLREASASLKREVRVWRAVAADPRTPRLARWLLGGAIAYLVSPLDLIPDCIPVIGYLDDAIIVGVAFAIAIRLIPPDVVEAARRHAR